MRKICERTGKSFNVKSNRQKYCKTQLCGECPLRPMKESQKPDLISIMDELGWEYDRNDSNEFHMRNENKSNGLQDDEFWGVGNIHQELQMKPRLFEGQLRAKKTRIHNVLGQIETGLVVGKVEYRTNANQFSKSKLKYTRFFVCIETGQYSTTTVKIPYHLAIGLINDIQ